MVMAFTTGFYDGRINGAIPEDTAQTVFRDIMADLAEGFSLHLHEKSLNEEAKKRTRTQHYYLAPPPSEIVIDLEISRQIATILCYCQTLGLGLELEQIVSKIYLEARVVNIVLFKGVYLPFLKILRSLILKKHIDISGSPFQPLFQQILTAYIDRYVRAEPQPPKDWVRARVNCSCRDCISLNTFLVDPVRDVGRFPLSKQRRHHLHKILDNQHGAITHTTDRNSSPETLFVTKSAGFQASKAAWKERCIIAKKHLEKLGNAN